MKQSDNNQCWYKIKNDKCKFYSDACQKYGINTDICVECKYSITSLSYQQNVCGSRYCQDCYYKLKERYKCSICKEENAANALHMRENIFVDKAMGKDLERMIIRCPDCHAELRVFQLEEHVKNCLEGWDSCGTCQDMVKKNSSHQCQKNVSINREFVRCESCGQEFRNSVKEHSCNIDWSGLCPFGCAVDCSKDTTHRAEICPKHIEICWSIISEYNLADFNSNEENKRSTQWLVPVAEAVKRDLKYGPADVSQLIRDVDVLTHEMIEETEINAIVRDTIGKQISEVHNTSFDGTLMWRIDNFSKVMDDAKKGLQKSIFSPPFYSSKFGYKMCLRLYPNGDTSAIGMAMSLFLVIMRGNYDAFLKWPFKQKVTFILLDPDFKTNWIDAFIPSENMSSFSRPRTDMNIPSGSSYFIKFEDLDPEHSKYAKDNTMFIRCIVDCSDLLN